MPIKIGRAGGHGGAGTPAATPRNSADFRRRAAGAKIAHAGLEDFEWRVPRWPRRVAAGGFYFVAALSMLACLRRMSSGQVLLM